jgi:hypothetical protein
MSTSTLPRRRTVIRTAAWTVPVVAASATAPAYAASCGSDTYAWVLDWGNNNGSAFRTSYPSPSTINGVRTGTAEITGPAGTSPMRVELKSTVVGTDRRTNNNLRVDAASYPNVAASGGTGLLLQHQNIVSGRANSRQEVVISFNRTVTGLTFTIADIDADSGGFWDRVELDGARTFQAVSRGGGNTYVIGNGVQRPNNSETDSARGAWRMYSDSLTAADNGDNRGNVTVTYAGPVDSITLRYWNSTGNANQAIFLGDFTFTATGC